MKSKLIIGIGDSAELSSVSKQAERLLANLKQSLGEDVDITVVSPVEGLSFTAPYIFHEIATVEDLAGKIKYHVALGTQTFHELTELIPTCTSVTSRLVQLWVEH